MQKYINALFFAVLFAAAVYWVRADLIKRIQKQEEQAAKRQEAFNLQAQAISGLQNDLKQVVNFINQLQQSQQTARSSPPPANLSPANGGAQPPN